MALSKPVTSETRISSPLVSFIHRMTIENFSIECGIPNLQTSSYITYQSCSFSPPNRNDIKFHLTIYPYGRGSVTYYRRSYKIQNIESSDFIEIYLNMDVCDMNFLKLKCKTWLADIDENEHYLKEGYHKMELNSAILCQSSIKRSDIFQQPDRLLPNDKLTIYCEISFVENTETIPGALNNFSELSQQASSLALDNFINMLDSGIHSDVVLCIATTDQDSGDEEIKEIKAHKWILASRSPVFAAMFENDMEESKQNRVMITDIKPEVVEAMLRYIYAGKIDSIEKYAMELLEVADKYDLNQLKNFCEQFLCLKLSNESVIDLLVLADLHNATELKTKSLDYIKKNFSSIFNTQKWNSFIANHVRLFNEALEAMFRLEG